MSMDKRRILTFCGFAAVLCLGGVLLGNTAVNAFCRPPAWVGGAFFGAPVSPAEPGAVLHLAGLEVAVGKTCSGMSFYLLLSGLMAWSVLRWKGGWRWLPVVALVAYAVTLFANSLRVVLAVFVREATVAFMGPSYAHSAHLAVGILIFLPLLIACSWLLERKPA